MNALDSLVITDRPGNVRHVELNKPALSIGRHAGNDLRILGARVSRRHAEIVREGEDFYLVDKGSKSDTARREVSDRRRRGRSRPGRGVVTG